MPPRDQGSWGSVMRRDLVGLTRPINNPLVFLLSKLSSLSNGVEEPGENHSVLSKWNSNLLSQEITRAVTWLLK